MDRANVNYAQRSEFRSDPKRAVEYLEDALKRRKVHKPAAYALARFRAGYFRAPPIEDLELEPPPTLELLELAWSWGMAEQGLAAMADSIAQHGGFKSLLPFVNTIKE